MKLTPKQKKTVDILNQLVAEEITNDEAIEQLTLNGTPKDFAIEMVHQTFNGGSTTEK